MILNKCRLSIVAGAPASLSHAFVRSWVGFALALLELGIGISENFPVSIKIISEWFTQKERTFVTGSFNGGSNMGQVFAPLIIPVIIFSFIFWQYVFVFLAFLSG